MEKADVGRNAASMIGAGVTINGDVECSIELQIGGRVNGDVRCDTLFLEEGGCVVGTVQAERLRVSGLVDGNVDVGDLAVEATGRLSGSVTFTRLKVSSGGVIEGTMTHRAAQPAPAGHVENVNLKLVDAEDISRRRIYVD